MIIVLSYDATNEASSPATSNTSSDRSALESACSDWSCAVDATDELPSSIRPNPKINATITGTTNSLKNFLDIIENSFREFEFVRT